VAHDDLEVVVLLLEELKNSLVELWGFIIMEEEIWQYHVWRTLFPGAVFTARSLPLPEEVLTYLAQDSLISPVETPELASFLSRLEEAIVEVDGQGVVPKLNWKVPQ
jgi:hypothetical protein